MSSDSYTILFEARARRHLARIDPVVRRRIAKAIDALAADRGRAAARLCRACPICSVSGSATTGSSTPWSPTLTSST
jgi:hypothetical protein